MFAELPTISALIWQRKAVDKSSVERTVLRTAEVLCSITLVAILAGTAILQASAAPGLASPIGRVQTQAPPASGTESVAQLRLLADRGDAKSQVRLGLLYQKGEGVSKDYGRAVDWFRKAADQGDGRGLHHLAVCYETGLGVELDPARAADYYRKGIERGDYLSVLRLSINYIKGLGVPRSYDEAIKMVNSSVQYMTSEDRERCVQLASRLTAAMTKAPLVYYSGSVVSISAHAIVLNYNGSDHEFVVTDRTTVLNSAGKSTPIGNIRAGEKITLSTHDASTIVEEVNPRFGAVAVTGSGVPQSYAAQAQVKPAANAETMVFEGMIGVYGLAMGSGVYFEMDIGGKPATFLLDVPTALKYKIIRQAPDGVGFTTPDFDSRWGAQTRLKVTCAKEPAVIGGKTFFKVVTLEAMQPAPVRKHTRSRGLGLA